MVDMVLALMNVTGSSNLTTPLLNKLPSPRAPDFTDCDGWYGGSDEGLELADCIDAWTKLPEGSSSISWQTKPRTDAFYSFPLVRSSGKCQIKITASGKYAEEHNITVSAAPDDLRLLALSTIEKCVGQKGQGGYTTKDFDKAVQWMIAPTTDFPTYLDLPPSITFFTAMVWNTRHVVQDKGYDSGNHDPWISLAFQDDLAAAAELAPDDSHLQLDLENRLEYVAVSAAFQEDRAKQRAWWESRPLLYGSGSRLGRNRTRVCNPHQGIRLPAMSNCTTGGEDQVNSE